MRKNIAFMLIISILILLSGCSGPSASNTTSDTTSVTTAPMEATGQITETTESTFPAPVDTQLPLSTISLPMVTESATADDGHIVFRYIHQNISLILPEPEVADRIILDFLNQLDTVSAHAETAADAAAGAYAEDSDMPPHLLQILYSPIRFDGSILSLYGEKVSYNGGPHSVYSGQSLNYDILTGKQLLLTDVLEDQVSRSELMQMLESSLSINPNQVLFPEYKTLLKDLIPAVLSECTNWYFSHSGLEFHFAPGEIASNSTGTVYASIPYEALVGTLKNAYFPAEVMLASGTISAQSFTTENLSQFERFSELILQDGGTKLLFNTDAPIYDVKIAEVTTFDITNEDFKAVTLYAAHTLSAKDAILLEADFESTKLMLSYQQPDGIQYFAISVTNGNVQLKKL